VKIGLIKRVGRGLYTLWFNEQFMLLGMMFIFSFLARASWSKSKKKQITPLVLLT
jgi:hypothetical protein